ncbi:MAG: GMC family oxidoreductase N-terminal domain-containing protein [Pseudomonadota bacterium]|nr:GMC family oxidoreductase N-terminal domain-containing protein [Pseudomonadota bacterium]
MGDFDYIIVGGGSSGATLAGRLSSNPSVKVLLLEAGPSDGSLKIKVPLGYGSLFYDQKFNWKYETEPEAELTGRKMYWPRGKVLGGSSAINAMVYVRGHQNDFKDWAKVAPSWSWSNVEPLFKKIEAWKGEYSSARGGSGPVGVSNVERDVHPLTNKYLEAGQELGFPLNRDYNGSHMEGVSVYQTTIANGLRVSSASAYISKRNTGRNLRVITNAHVTKLIFDGRRATGVCFSQGNRETTVLTDGEVILSAGALNSPHLLYLSGLGPANELQPHGISVLQDMPHVGRHLQDHIGVDFTLAVNRPSLNQKLRPVLGKFLVGLEYLFFKSGPLAMSLNQAGGFVKSDPSLEAPDLQLYFSPLSYSTAPQGKRPLMSPDPYPAVRLGFNPTKPTSEGWISLKSSDPFESPKFVGNYLSTEEDKKVMISGMHLMRKFLKTKAMRDIVEEELSPGSDFNDDKSFMDFARSEGGTVFHQCGTCRMGKDISSSVVDESLKVHGIDGLRVADASIFPRITTGNTNAPSIMVGEKAADIILAEQKI